MTDLSSQRAMAGIGFVLMQSAVDGAVTPAVFTPLHIDVPSTDVDVPEPVFVDSTPQEETVLALAGLPAQHVPEFYDGTESASLGDQEGSFVDPDVLYPPVDQPDVTYSQPVDDEVPVWVSDDESDWASSWTNEGGDQGDVPTDFLSPDVIPVEGVEPEALPDFSDGAPDGLTVPLEDVDASAIVPVYSDPEPEQAPEPEPSEVAVAEPEGRKKRGRGKTVTPVAPQSGGYSVGRQPRSLLNDLDWIE